MTREQQEADVETVKRVATRYGYYVADHRVTDPERIAHLKAARHAIDWSTDPNTPSRFRSLAHALNAGAGTDGYGE